MIAADRSFVDEDAARCFGRTRRTGEKKVEERGLPEPEGPTTEKLPKCPLELETSRVSALDISSEIGSVPE